MRVLNVTQGTAEWHLARDTHFCASDAPAMMGSSKYKTRADLLKAKATGLTETITPEKQALLDSGHASEAAIRPYIASILGDELFPVVAEEGRLLASLDGITMDDETIFEHKLWNEALATQIEVGELEPHYYWQLEHQLHVSKAKRVIFVCSDGTPNKCVHMFYEPVPGRVQTLLAGWNQFDADLCAYSAPVPDAITEKKALMALPALSVQLVGKVTTSNLPAYRDSALEFIKAINTELQTDQDFADAETTVKFCETAEKNIQDVKAQAIAQTASIDELFRSLDQIADAMRSKRLMLDKLVKSRKEQIRAEIITSGRNNWNAHVNELNRLLHRVSVTIPMPDFMTAIKGKRTLASLREAVDSVLTGAKISATQQSELFTSRLAIIDEVAKDHAFLVRDLSALVAMPTETLSAVIKQRITDHQAEQDRKADLARQAEAVRVQRENDAAAERARLGAPVAPLTIPSVTQYTPPIQRHIEPMSVAPGTPGGEPAAVATVHSIPQSAGRSGAYSAAPSRPTDGQILAVLALHFRAPESEVIEWLLEMDLEQAGESVRGAF